MLNQPKVRKEAQAIHQLQIVWESPGHSVLETTAQNPNPMLARRLQFQAHNLRDPKQLPRQLRDEYTLPENTRQCVQALLSLNSNDNPTGRAYQPRVDGSQTGPGAC